MQLHQLCCPKYSHRPQASTTCSCQAKFIGLSVGWFWSFFNSQLSSKRWWLWRIYRRRSRPRLPRSVYTGLWFQSWRNFSDHLGCGCVWLAMWRWCYAYLSNSKRPLHIQIAVAAAAAATEIPIGNTIAQAALAVAENIKEVFSFVDGSISFARTEVTFKNVKNVLSE